jgi:signal transduction histidine kinase
MRLSSLRFRILLLTIFFALILVGAVSAVTYVVVSDAMADVAESTVLNMASSASQAVREAVTDAKLAASSRGLVGSRADEAAYQDVLAQLPELLLHSSTTPGHYALYDGSLHADWYSSPDALNDHDAHRIAAQRDQQTVDAGPAGVASLTGIFVAAQMGEYTAHVPVELPGEGAGVLDVTYLPEREEATIDRIRPWMMLLSAVAVILATALMQVSAGLVLGLVGDLRRAADSIDANQLDVRLPDLGKHEIGDLTRSLNALLERLKRRAEAQTRFVADASHELATPVAGIRGYVNILREWGGEDPALREEAIEAIDRESSRMARLCGDLLSLIRRERFADLEIRRVDVNAIAREALAGAATRYLGKRIEFVGPEEGPLFVHADQDHLTQLLGILVDNAAKYSDAEGRVEVSTQRRGDWVVIQVSDRGVGIPERDLPHIFDRFYRSDESRSSETGGFGIGLSIARSLVELMGGKIDVDSTEGEGTTFTVRLPRKPRDAE